jgi:predicted glycoside hydrolase/deacetylase ChbG (UPF0249 family)
MLIINADDWGGWGKATDAALACHARGRITSVTAMVFMEDSERAAELAGENRMDVGLHLNLDFRFTAKAPLSLSRSHERIVRFLTRNKYSALFYNPLLRKDFFHAYRAQVEEFQRLYGTPPSHVDGHHHQHLCANMQVERIIPPGQKIRRNFSFWPGEKSLANRIYRRLVDRWLGRSYRLTDFFFSLEQCLKEKRLSRVVELAKAASVELMTHPEKTAEYEFLMSDEYLELMRGIQLHPYAAA